MVTFPAWGVRSTPCGHAEAAVCRRVYGNDVTAGGSQLNRGDRVGQGRPPAELTEAVLWREGDHVLLRPVACARTYVWPHTIVGNGGDGLLMYMPEGNEITRARTASGDGRRNLARCRCGRNAGST